MEAKWPTLLAPIRANPVSKFGSLTYNRWSCHATWNHMTMNHTAICRWRENKCCTDHVTYYTNFGCLSWHGLIDDTHKPVNLGVWGASGCGRFVSAAARSCPNDAIVYPDLPGAPARSLPSCSSVQTGTPLHVTGRPPFGLPLW